MEDLTKTQIVLLCLLVSFVTSIGTGIIASSLLQEAPQTVTQTINRVVERTVQTIVPQNTNSPSPTNTVTKETTVVVKEEDLVIDSIKQSRNSLVWILENVPRAQPVVRGIGVVIKKDGTILADRRFFSPGSTYSVKFFSDNTVLPVVVAKRSQVTNAIFLTPAPSTGSQKTFSPITFGTDDNVQLGQTVISMGGKDKEAVAIGRITQINQINLSTTTKAVGNVVTDTPLHDGIPGSILLNLNGVVVGFESYDIVSGDESLYTAMNVLRRDNPTFFEPAKN